MLSFLNISNVRTTRKSTAVLLLFIIGVSLFLRINGINWDNGNFFHPDERSILMRVDCMYRILGELPGYLSCMREFPSQESGLPSLGILLDAEKSPLNPHWFPLGGFILYLLLAVKMGISLFFAIDLVSLSMIGRFLAATADIASLVLVFILGKRLYGKTWGLLAAAIVGFSVINIQISHFYRPEPFLNLFLLGSFWQMFQLVNKLRYRNSALLGGFIGLALATKITSLPIFLPVCAIYAYHLINHLYARRFIAGSKANITKGLAYHICIFLGFTVGIFVLLNPYAILSFNEFLGWILREGDIVRTAGLVPYTTQYIDSTPFLYEIRQLSLWGLGLPIGIVCWLGLIAAIIKNIRKPQLAQVLILLWVLPVFAIVGSFETKFLRYLFPIVPFLILFGTGLIKDTYHWLRDRNINQALLVTGMVAFLGVPTIVFSVSFQSIYESPHPAVQASDWINNNVSSSTVIITDNHWDEGIPDLGKYDVRQFPAYEHDSIEKAQRLSTNLSQAQYVVFYSNRTYGSIRKAQDKYPLTSNYYYLLMDGQLGYKLMKSFSSYPKIMDIAITNDTFSEAGLNTPYGNNHTENKYEVNLGYADENVINYDHPLVLLFSNEEYMSAEQIFGKISFVSEESTHLLIDDEQLTNYRQSGTWENIFGSNKDNEVTSVFLWLLLFQILIIGAFPVACYLFRDLPDYGIGLSGSLGLLLVGYVLWICASLSILPFNRLSITAIVVLLCIVSILLVLRQKKRFSEIVRSKWKHITFVELLFLGAFVVFLGLRMANPDLWHPFRGGEKPMDLAYLTAIIKSEAMPPYDPWFSGGYINYYYFGHFLVAVLVKMTGILPSTAYNLALPLLFSMSVLAAFSVVYNLAEIVRRKRFPKSNTIGPYAAGLIAAFLTFGLGNQGGARQLLASARDVIAEQGSFPAFDFWASSRIIPGIASITEFPYWTFLFGDLHAHLIAMPFYLLTVFMVISLVFLRQSGKPVLITHILCLSLALGAQAAINTWDLPVFTFITILGMGVFTYNNYRSEGTSWLQKWIVLSTAVVGLAWFAYLPFHSSYDPYPLGIIFSSHQTQLADYLLIHLPFVILGVTFIALSLSGTRPDIGQPCFSPKRLLEKTFWQRKKVIICTAIGCIVLIAWVAGYLMAGLLTAVISIAVIALIGVIKKDAYRITSEATILVLLITAMGIGIVPELITVAGDIERMNTVFKLYLQAWILYAIAAGFISWYFFAAGFHRRFVKRKILGSSWVIIISLTLVAGLIFPALGTRSRLQDRFQVLPPTLNGEAYTENAVYSGEQEPIALKWDMEAIKWLRSNVEGSPVILEAALPHQYRWGSRVSVYTGLPTVIGWIWHQKQQRGQDANLVDRRQRQVDFIYSTTDSDMALNLIKKYDVDFIYIGHLERLYYDADGLNKFDSGNHDWAQLVYSNQEVKIYRTIR